MLDLVVLTTLILLFVVALLYRLIGGVVICPECGSHRAKRFNKTVREIKYEEGESMFDKGIIPKVFVDASYRCRHCQHEWRIVEPD